MMKVFLPDEGYPKEVLVKMSAEEVKLLWRLINGLLDMTKASPKEKAMLARMNGQVELVPVPFTQKELDAPSWGRRRT